LEKRGGKKRYKNFLRIKRNLTETALLEDKKLGERGGRRFEHFKYNIKFECAAKLITRGDRKFKL